MYSKRQWKHYWLNKKKESDTTSLLPIIVPCPDHDIKNEESNKKPKILAHIGARGTAYWNVRLLCHLFDFEEVRIHSKRVESRENFANKLSEDLKRPIKVTDDWENCILDADIVVEASRLSKPEPLLKTEWIKKGALVIPYGTMSALEFSLPDIMDKFVMDDWGQAHGVFGALREHIDKGKITFETLHAEIGRAHI